MESEHPGEGEGGKKDEGGRMEGLGGWVFWGRKMGPEGQKNRGDEILLEWGEKLVSSVVCVSVCLFVQIRAFICMCGSCMRACDCLDVRTKGRPLPFFFFFLSFFLHSRLPRVKAGAKGRVSED